MIRITNVQRDLRVDSDYSFLRGPTQRWLDRMDQYHRAVKRKHEVDDWPFWFGERPLVGFLAAGFWDAGGVCIEEFRTDKKAEKVAEATQPRKKTFIGRGDLYFCLRGIDGNIEFKLHDMPVSKTDHFASSLRRKLIVGRRDAKKAHQTGIDDYCGMFLRPYIGKSRNPRFYESNVKQLLKVIWETLEPATLAWWCPIRRVLDSDKTTTNVILGSILVIIRV